MVVLIVITALYHIVLIKGYHPLVDYLPLSVAPKMAEQQGLTNGYQANNGTGHENGEAPALGASTTSRTTPREKEQSSAFSLSSSSSASTLHSLYEADSSRLALAAFPPPARSSFDDHRKPLREVESNRTDQDNNTLPGDEHLDVNAFDHPAIYKDYPTVWIPKDPAGLYRDELEGSQAAGVDISAEGARMDEKAKVDIDRSPPDEEWDDSQDI